MRERGEQRGEIEGGETSFMLGDFGYLPLSGTVESEG